MEVSVSLERPSEYCPNAATVNNHTPAMRANVDHTSDQGCRPPKPDGQPAEIPVKSSNWERLARHCVCPSPETKTFFKEDRIHSKN